MAKITEPADFDVAIELVAKLVAHYNREQNWFNELGKVFDADVAKKRGDFWFAIRNQLYQDHSINAERLNAIIAETGSQLRNLRV